jgi:dihydropteroate synthase
MSKSLVNRIHEAHATRPLVMGIVNVTPDSFSDGGRFDSPDRALAHALTLVEEGADILDVGGESTRPGADPVSAQQEMDRVLPVIERIVAETDTPVSIDTVKSEVMREALAAGAGMINDVKGLRGEGVLDVVASTEVPVCIMHMQGEPRTMQKNPEYHDVVDDIRHFFEERLAACRAAGIDARRVVLDPGFGFGKTLAHNLALLRRLDEFVASGWPVLAGISRKSMLGKITGRERADERVAASVSAALLAAQKGAAILRVHDVAETVDALKVWQAVRESSQ